MGVFSENAIIGASAAGGYEIDQSLRVDGFPGTTQQILTRSPSSSGNRKTFTISFWWKPSLFNKAEDDYVIKVKPNNSNVMMFNKIAGQDKVSVYTAVAGSGRTLKTSRIFRDPAAWYHFVITVDTTQATASNRVKLYVNGVQETDFDIEEYPDQDAELPYNESGVNQDLVYSREDSGRSPSGYFAEWHSIDGQALTPASFGETNSDTNQWQAIKYAGSYGTNGFYLKFQDSSALGDDSSGNTNDFTSTNLAATDQVLDSPTNNFATLNPLETSTYNLWTYSEGNLKGYGTPGDNFTSATFIMKSGKWYFEVDITDNGGKAGMYVSLNGLDDHYLSESFDERIINGPANTGLYGVSIDMDAGSWSTTYNGSSFQSGSFTPQECKIGFTNGTGAFIKRFVVNFGQDSSFAGARTAQGNTDSNNRGDFFYTPATGYLALCTANLDDPSIADPTEYFSAVTWSGDGTSSRSITSGVDADWVWYKDRTGTENHSLYDSIRGAQQRLISNSTDLERTRSGGLQSFDSTGFTVGSDTECNGSGKNYVGWTWKAGGTAVSNTDGSITSSVSASPTAGFSIVSWTGTGSNVTVGHGLSQAPELIINKSRDSAYNWAVQSILFNSASDTNLLYLNTTAAEADDTNVFQAAPTATVFSPQGGSWSGIGASGVDYIAYCFHGVDGYSKVGTYSGNSSDDGTFVYTGFRPAWVLIKCYAGHSSQEWVLLDNQRPQYNVVNKFLYANASNAEDSNLRNVDFVSNGIKMRSGGTAGTGGPVNISGRDYIYLAFAESPFKTANAR